MSQKFLILVSAPPTKPLVHLSAIRFIKESLHLDLPIASVFFYQDAVSVANSFDRPPSDEPQLTQLWADIASNNGIELQTCVAASYRRGIIDEHQARELEFSENNLHQGFTLTGLGQLAASLNDETIQLIHFK